MPHVKVAWAIRESGEDDIVLALIHNGKILHQWPQHVTLSNRVETINILRRQAEEIAGGELDWQVGPFYPSGSTGMDLYRARAETIDDGEGGALIDDGLDEYELWRDLAS